MATQLVLMNPPRPSLMPRPKEADEDVIKDAVQFFMPEMLAYLRDGGRLEVPESEIPEIAEDIEDLFLYCYDEDSYEMSQYLKLHHHWEVNRGLIDVLDNADTHLRKAYRQAVSEWLEAFQVQPKLAIDASVQVKVQGQQHSGIITQIDYRQGKYTVMIPVLGHVQPGPETEAALKVCGQATHGHWLDWEVVEAQNHE